jgi:O-antigen ligase
MSFARFWRIALLALPMLTYISYIYSGMFWYIVYKDALQSQVNVYISLSALLVIVAYSIVKSEHAGRTKIVSVLLSKSGAVLFFAIYILICAIYSPSNLSRDVKLSYALINIPSAFLIGLLIFQKEVVAEFVLYVLALSIFGAIFVTFQFSNYESYADSVIHYQNINAICGGGAIFAMAALLDKEIKPTNRLLAAIVFVVLCFAVLRSGGRGGFLGLGVGVFVILAMRLRKYAVAIGLAAVVAWYALTFEFASVASFLEGVAVKYELYTIQRILGKVSTSYEGPLSREWLGEKATEVWLNSPFFGAGLGGYAVSAGFGDSNLYPHNIVLELLAEHGVFGLAAFVVLLMYYYSAAYRRWSLVTDLEKFVLVGSAVWDFAVLNVSGQFVADRLLWFTLGACAAISARSPKRAPARAGELMGWMPPSHGVVYCRNGVGEARQRRGR